VAIILNQSRSYRLSNVVVLSALKIRLGDVYKRQLKIPLLGDFIDICPFNLNNNFFDVLF